MKHELQSASSASSLGFRIYRIRTLGDSITAGWDGGYRADLLRNQPNKMPFLMVGGSTEYSPQWMYNIGEERHDGYPGFRIDQLVSIAAKPRLADIVLVHVGTNDILQGKNGDDTAQWLNYLLVTLLNQNRQAMVLVAQILPIFTYGNEKEQAVHRYNSLVPFVVKQFEQWGRTVRVVDMFSGFTQKDLLDGVHPTPAGYWKMADRWKTAINDLPSLASVDIPGVGE
jgi:hypothetical protein